MPLPWRLPSDQETDERYRRIDQLLADLYALLRHILIGDGGHLPQVEAGDAGAGNGDAGRRSNGSGNGRTAPTIPDLLAGLETAQPGTPDSVDSDKSADVKPWDGDTSPKR